MIRWSILIIICSCFYSCIEFIDIEFSSDNQKLVVEGEISNDAPPYFFRVSKTGKINAEYHEGVSNVLLILSDNEGCVDTLQPLMKEVYSYSKDYFLCYYCYRDVAGDTIPLSGAWCKKDWPETVLDGFFVSNHIIGKPGNTYTLTVEYNDNTYRATETMLPVPELTNFKVDYIEHEKEGYQLTPFVDFINPKNQTNYYLFSFNRFSFSDLVYSREKNWPFSIIDGSQLPEKISNFKVNDGETVKGYPDNMWYPLTERDTATIRLAAISELCYDFYSNQIDQMRYDGGAYTPTPFSVNNNFGNEILGFFRVLSIDKKSTIYNSTN